MALLSATTSSFPEFDTLNSSSYVFGEHGWPCFGFISCKGPAGGYRDRSGPGVLELYPEVRAGTVAGRGIRAVCAAAWAMGRRSRNRRLQQQQQRSEGEENGDQDGRRRNNAVGTGLRSAIPIAYRYAPGLTSRSVASCSVGLGRRLPRDRQGEQAVRALLPGAQDRARGRVGPVHGSSPGAPPGHAANYGLQKVGVLWVGADLLRELGITEGWVVGDGAGRELRVRGPVHRGIASLGAFA